MPHPAAAASGLLATLLLAGCGGRPDAAEGNACPEPAAATRTADLPPALELPVLGTLTEVVRGQRAVNAVAVTDGTIEDLQPRVARALEDAGYTVVGEENEIVEADVFFARGQRTTGGAKLLEGPCQGQVTTRLFVSR